MPPNDGKSEAVRISPVHPMFTRRSPPLFFAARGKPDFAERRETPPLHAADHPVYGVASAAAVKPVISTSIRQTCRMVLEPASISRRCRSCRADRTSDAGDGLRSDPAPRRMSAPEGEVYLPDFAARIAATAASSVGPNKWP